MSYLYVKWNCSEVKFARRCFRDQSMICLRWSLPERRPATAEAARLVGSEGVSSGRVLGQSRPDRVLTNIAASAVCITSDLLVARSELRASHLSPIQAGAPNPVRSTEWNSR